MPTGASRRFTARSFPGRPGDPTAGKSPASAQRHPHRGPGVTQGGPAVPAPGHRPAIGLVARRHSASSAPPTGLGVSWNIGCLDPQAAKSAPVSETDRYNCTPDWAPVGAGGLCPGHHPGNGPGMRRIMGRQRRRAGTATALRRGGPAHLWRLRLAGWEVRPVHPQRGRPGPGATRSRWPSFAGLKPRTADQRRGPSRAWTWGRGGNRIGQPRRLAK